VAQETEDNIKQKIAATYKGGEDKLFSVLTENINSEDLLEFLGDRETRSFDLRLFVDKKGRTKDIWFYQLKNANMRKVFVANYPKLKSWLPSRLDNKKVSDNYTMHLCVTLDSTNSPVLSINHTYIVPEAIQGTVTKKGGFVNGTANLNRILYNRFRVPDFDKHIKSIGIIVEVEVSENGDFMGIDVINEPGYGVYEEVNRLFWDSALQKWIPNEVDGKYVKSTFSIRLNVTNEYYKR
jgi:hypothetical protein